MSDGGAPPWSLSDFNHIRVAGEDVYRLVSRSGQSMLVSFQELVDMLREGGMMVARKLREKHKPPTPPTEPMSPIVEETVLAVAA